MANPGADPLDTEHVGSGTESASEPESGTESATARAEQLSDRVKGKTADLKRQAQDAVRDVGARARSTADEQKNVAAERVGGVARALRVASDDLDDQGQPMVAGYSRQIAEGLESMAQSLSRRSVDELVEGVEDFARQRPVAFMGGAMAAGFALARFMKSSAARRSPRTVPHRRPYAAAAGAASTSPGAAMPTAATRPATTANQETPDAAR